MSNMLATGAAYLEAQRTAHAAQTVVYVRGSDSVSVTATIGRTIFRTENSFGFIEHYEARDYLILVADLVIDGVALDPTPGDKIQETVGSTVYTYEVMAPGGEPCRRHSDDFRITWRIHTKQVNSEVIS